MLILLLSTTESRKVVEEARCPVQHCCGIPETAFGVGVSCRSAKDAKSRGEEELCTGELMSRRPGLREGKYGGSSSPKVWPQLADL